ncbi:GNAT family N-acetyltransferase [Streptomyces sp. NPDC058955]|uniref:GNAT family N-acetyltransferase n=1 Tax=unclassified Streptomyces TaxID=2593676 RepID=UPI003655B68C
MTETERQWVEGWAVCRRIPKPVDVPWGLRLEVGQPTQTVRHVLLGDGTDAGTARALVESITEPTTVVKAFLPGDAMAPWFPPSWEPVDPCFLMAVDLRPSTVRVPDGYTVIVETTDGVVSARILAADGELAAAGLAGLTDTACVYDQIITEPAHQRRGLGTVVMGSLTDAALAKGVSRGVLGATVQGRALYETLGWQVLAPLNGFVHRPRS